MRIIAYYLPKRECICRELGAYFFDRLDERTNRRLVTKLVGVEYQVTLKPGRAEAMPETA
jgi:hypothetical protein